MPDVDVTAPSGAPWWRGASARLWAVAVGAALAAVAVVVLVAGIATRSGDAGAAGSDPAGLAGVWRVSDADDPTAEVWLWLRPEATGWLDLWRSCGWSSGAWDASRTGFLALIEAGSGGCEGVGGENGPRWLTAAASYSATDDGWQLHDAAGEVLATLTADEPPELVREAIDLSGGPTAATEALAEALAEPRPLASGLVRAAPHDLVGEWVIAPGGGPGGTASLDVRADGTWYESDGCNGTRGRWALEDEGRLLVASSGLTTLEDCPGADIHVPLALAGRAGFDGDVLVLVGGGGEELARLVRDTGSGPADPIDGADDDGDDVDDGPYEPGVANDPLGLVGLWRVTDARDPSAESWLWLGDASGSGPLELWRPCGWVFGSWDAGPRAFVGSIRGLTGTCGQSTAEDAEWYPSWLADVTAYAATEDGWMLLDSAGEPVATLVADTLPPTVLEAPGGPGGLPAVTDALREGLAEPAPLPAGLVAPTTQDLLGRWVPVDGPYSTDPHVTFVDGRWDGSDGCNAVGARWALDEGAHLVSAADVGITMMGCEGDPTAIELTGAERLGFDDDVLVLLDASGAELGRLERP